MGCCCGKEEESSQYEESSDRARLVDSTNNCTIENFTNDVHYGNDYHDVQQKLDDQTGFNKLLHNMAANAIDVHTLGSYGMESHEYKERSSYYATKLRTYLLSNPQWGNPHESSLIDIPQPEEAFVAENLVSEDDLETMYQMARDIDKIMEAIRIDRPDNLIVPFRSISKLENKN